MKYWSESDLQFMRENYPSKGKLYCAQHLGRNEGSVRWKAWELGLSLDTSSDFYKDFQRRAALKKIGVKRPAQSLVMKRTHAEGKFKKTPEQLKAMGLQAAKMIREKGHPRGALGMRHTAETRAKISEAHKKIAASKTEEEIYQRVQKSRITREKNGTLWSVRTNCTWKAAWEEIGGKRNFYRSRWEANYARYLQSLKLDGSIQEWEHEPETFWFEGIKRGCVSYLPDFRVTNIDGSIEFHEVKGWMDERSVTKIKRMTKYHPHIKLIVISSKEYKALEKRCKSRIAGWK